MQVAGSTVQTVVVTGTSRTYRCSRASNSSRKWPARPYPSSATTQSRATVPRTETRRTSSAAIRGLVRNVTSSGMWALARRSRGSAGAPPPPPPVPGLGGRLAPRLGQEQLVVQQRRPGRGHADQEDADLAVVLLAEPAVMLPGHAGGMRPLLGEGRLIDDPDDADRGAGRRGGQLVDEEGLGLGLDVVVRPGAGADELLQAGDIAVADQQRDRLDALALGADHQPFDVVISMILGLLLAEERGEPLVEVDELLGRGAHVIRRHGGPS